MTQEITLTRPDDWHLHVRDGAALATVVPHTARQFGRAIIMPNLKPPVTTAAEAAHYRARIRAVVPAGVDFEPLMTLYLTDKLPPEEIGRARAAGVDTEVLLMWDDPARALEAVAHERGSRVIVVGSHCEGRFAGAIGRHTPFELLHHTDVPVLVVPHRH